MLDLHTALTTVRVDELYLSEVKRIYLCHRICLYPRSTDAGVQSRVRDDARLY